MLRIMSTARIFIVLTYFFQLASNFHVSFDDGTNNSCWKQSYNRGLGTFPDTCDANADRGGLACYPKCQAGYKGAGPVCWEACPSGFNDIGLLCLKPNSYSRGLGYALWNNDTCLKENPQGCELVGLVWYPKCENGLVPSGCCMCAPPCLEGAIDLGLSCSKKSYGRSLGTPLQCQPGYENHAGLCYEPCRAGFRGVGSTCHQICPTGYVDCGRHCSMQTCLSGLPASGQNCTAI